MTYISWSSDFALYLQDYLMDKDHTWYNGSVWYKDWPHKIYIYRWVTYISWSSDFALYLENYLMDEGHTLDKIYAGQWPIFHGPVILLNILKTVWWRNIIFGIMDQCDTKVGLIKQMWVSDLILSHILITIWWMKVIDDIMDQCDTKIDLIKYM